jgi:hypothetical protein
VTDDQQDRSFHLRFDQQQLETALVKIRRETKRVSPGDVLALVQSVALVLGGCWVAFQMFTVRAEQERTALRTLQKQDEQLGLTLRRTQERRFHIDTRATIQKLDTNKDGGSNYYVEYAYLPENTSDVVINFQFAVIDIYIGARRSPAVSGDAIFPINGPLDNDEHVLWRHLATQVFQDRSANAWAKAAVMKLILATKMKFKVVEEGAALASGERARFIRPYMVTAKPGAWLGFVLSYGVDNTELWTTDYYDLENTNLRNRLSMQQHCRMAVESGRLQVWREQVTARHVTLCNLEIAGRPSGVVDGSV